MKAVANTPIPGSKYLTISAWQLAEELLNGPDFTAVIESSNSEYPPQNIENVEVSNGTILIRSAS